MAVYPAQAAKLVFVVALYMFCYMSFEKYSLPPPMIPYYIKMFPSVVRQLWLEQFSFLKQESLWYFFCKLRNAFVFPTLLIQVLYVFFLQIQPGHPKYNYVIQFGDKSGQS
jgi:hypothetical protein